MVAIENDEMVSDPVKVRINVLGRDYFQRHPEILVPPNSAGEQNYFFLQKTAPVGGPGLGRRVVEVRMNKSILPALRDRAMRQNGFHNKAHLSNKAYYSEQER
jgi:hypothetical protein